MASRNLPNAVRLFGDLDSRTQLDVLKRVGIETETADVMLGHIRANLPDRWTALVALDPSLASA